MRFCELDIEEQAVAARVVAKLGERFKWPRVVEIFRTLARQDALVYTSGKSLLSSCLLRDEREAACGVVLALILELPEDEQVKRVVECLTAGQSLLDATALHRLISSPPAPRPAAPWFEEEEVDGTVVVM